MAIFGKKSTGNTQEGGASVAKEKSSAAPRGAAGEGSISIIGPGMRIVGDLTTDGTVRVEGSIEGRVRAGKGVVIGKDGEVVGDVEAEEAVVGGRIRGTLTAGGRIHLQATCDFEGEIRANPKHLLLEEGARFNGQVQMGDATAAPQRALPPGEKQKQQARGAPAEAGAGATGN